MLPVEPPAERGETEHDQRNQRLAVARHEALDLVLAQGIVDLAQENVLLRSELGRFFLFGFRILVRRQGQFGRFPR